MPTQQNAAMNAIPTYIEKLERSFLEGMIPDEFHLAGLFDDSKQAFFSIQGLVDFWSSGTGASFEQCITDLLVGAHNREQTAITFILAGTPQKLSVFISLGKETITRSLLTGILPGIELAPEPMSRLASRLGTHFQVKGVLSGIPSRKPVLTDQTARKDLNKRRSLNSTADTARSFQVERIIRGMQGATWGYIAQALPLSRREVAKARLAVVDLLAQMVSQSRLQTQATEQKNLQVTASGTDTHMRSVSAEMINYRAQYLVQLLERELERLDEGMAVGQWNVSTYFGASTREDAQRLGALLVGALGGPDSRPDPLRSYLCRAGAAQLVHFHTPLSSSELALLIQLPREEVPGYAIHDFARFDTDFSPSDQMGLALGSIQQHGHDTQNSYAISLDDLTKHALVTGVTGSGKTTTVMNVLDRVIEAQKPFLVIEPAKTEYRALYSKLVGRADLRIYTLGNELVAPFRLNPFEFETDNHLEGAPLLSHIDFLKAAFNAAFILYAPMPYVLETALHEVYEDKGWDLASGQNARLPDWTERHLYPIFPTLTDLYRKVEVVTTRLGYHDEVERNVKAGLKARIGAMRLGAKGLMLDTARGLTMKELLEFPTILELEHIGSDDEKAFLMGILLARLYEYRRLQAMRGAITPGLQHLIVFEEAHRLLKNTSTVVDVESANLRAQAIEVFTNMLSEVRAYGQGVLVAEQIPSKLTPDVLKNTNLKIAHRLIAQDDRESIGQTMNLTAEQILHLGVLPPGKAAVYAEGADHAYLVQFAPYKEQLFPLSDAHLKELSPRYASVAPYQAIRDMQQYDLPCTSFGGPDAKAYHDAGQLLETEKSKALWATILLRAVFHPDKLPDLLTGRLARGIAEEMPHLSDEQHQMMLRMVLVCGCAAILDERGAHAGWPYPLMQKMRRYLTRALISILQTQECAGAEADLQQFAKLYQQHARREYGPFAGCTHCRQRCLFRAEVRHLLSAKDRKWVDDDLKSTRYQSQAERYSAIARATRESMATLWLGGPHELAAALGYCAALHATAQSGYTEYEQALVGDQLAPFVSQLAVP